ncbi:MAG: hypothetical protein HOG49_24885 [Candidatus Scalindua sp.]|nr:hypothetical protein [Candidatus Scalindua sp.]
MTNLVTVRNTLNALIEEYGEEGSRISLEGGWDYRESVLHYKRLETDNELDRRKKSLEKSKKLKMKKEEATKKKELTMLKDLKEKYEGL